MADLPALQQFNPTTQLDIPNALAAHSRLQQMQRGDEAQNALAQAVPMLQSDPQNAFATAAKTSPQAALQLLPVIKQMDDQKKAALADRVEAIGKLALSLKQYKDPAVRKAVAQSQASTLAAHGVTPEQIQNFDYSDNNLDMTVNSSMSVKELIAQTNADRTYDAGRSDHKDTLANEAANRGVTIRGQNMTDARAKDANGKTRFDNPVEVEVNDGQGGTKQVLAQQDKVTGQWMTADQNRSPLDSTNMRVIKSDATGGGRVAGQVMRLMGSAKQATAELKNLAELPLGASTGWFGGHHQGTSLFGATKEVLASKVTSQDVQDTNVTMIGMGRALAGLESGGMQPNQTLQDQFSGLALKEGDTNMTKMRKLATMRQDADNALEAALTSPILGKEQKAYAQKLREELKTAIPWTPSDVTRLERSDNPRASLKDFGDGKGLGAPDSGAHEVWVRGKDGKLQRQN